MVTASKTSLSPKLVYRGAVQQYLLIKLKRNDKVSATVESAQIDRTHSGADRSWWPIPLDLIFGGRRFLSVRYWLIECPQLFVRSKRQMTKSYNAEYF